MKTYFITGATGAVGSALVERLLFETNAQIQLLIRAENPVRLAQRMNSLWAFWRISPDATEFRNRVKAIPGDALLPRFGMDRKDYDELAEQCTHIVHSAGNVRMNLPIDTARRFALGSARNIVDLAENSKTRGLLEKVEFVSTVGVAGKMPGVLPETWITQKREFHNTYEQAKAEAEEFIRKKVEEDGLPVTVHRPSMVVGDSRTGKIIHFQVFYHLCEFMAGNRTSGFVPDLSGFSLDIIPVDFVTKALLLSSRKPETRATILHLCSGPDGAVDLMDLLHRVRDIFRSTGKRVPRKKIVPLSVFKVAVSLLGQITPPERAKALKALPVFWEYLSEKQSFSNRNIKDFYGSQKMVLPKADHYLKTVLQYYLQKQRSAL